MIACLFAIYDLRAMVHDDCGVGAHKHNNEDRAAIVACDAILVSAILVSA